VAQSNLLDAAWRFSEVDRVDEVDRFDVIDRFDEAESIDDPNTQEKFVDLIENPLPVPKKHERKQMDFCIQPKFEQLKFDVAIPEYDDFDI
jgi:hypothetical protein